MRKELMNAHLKFRERLNYYNGEGSHLYDEITRTARISFNAGEIDFFRFAASMETALQIKLDYLDNLQEYNRVTLMLNYQSEQ